MNNQRLTILIIAGIGILATVLPWFKTPLGTVNGIDREGGEGYIMLLLFFIPLIISLLGNRNQLLGVGSRVFCFIPSISAGILGIIILTNFNQLVEAELAEAAAIKQFFSIGIGLYLVILTGFSLTIIALIGNRSWDKQLDKYRNNLDKETKFNNLKIKNNQSTEKIITTTFVIIMVILAAIILFPKIFIKTTVDICKCLTEPGNSEYMKKNGTECNEVISKKIGVADWRKVNMKYDKIADKKFDELAKSCK